MYLRTVDHSSHFVSHTYQARRPRFRLGWGCEAGAGAVTVLGNVYHGMYIHVSYISFTGISY